MYWSSTRIRIPFRQSFINRLLGRPMATPAIPALAKRLQFEVKFSNIDKSRDEKNKAHAGSADYRGQSAHLCQASRTCCMALGYANDAICDGLENPREHHARIAMTAIFGSFSYAKFCNPLRTLT